MPSVLYLIHVFLRPLYHQCDLKKQKKLNFNPVISFISFKLIKLI